jgi:hypothetical protein
MAPIIRPLRQLSHQLNVAIVLSHHQNKAGESRGSTAIRASVDQELHWKLDEESHHLCGKLRVMGRLGPKQIIHARLGNEGRFEATGGAVPGARSQTLRERVHGALERSRRWLEPQMVHDAVNEDGFAEVTLGGVKNVLTQMAQSGELLSVEGEAPRQPNRYRLADAWDGRAT